MDLHVSPSSSPCDERPVRTQAVMQRLNGPGSNVMCSLTALSAQQSASRMREVLEAIQLVHPDSYVQHVRNLSAAVASTAGSNSSSYRSGNAADIFFSASTFEAAVHAAGAGTHLVDQIFKPTVAIDDSADNGEIAVASLKRGFAIVRPPGHHAGPNSSAGFCIFNNAAISAAYAIHAYPQQVHRVLVLDIDIHHGNGTQEMFYNRSDVCTISIHKQTFLLHGEQVEYPEEGRADHIGTDAGLGYNINVPLGNNCGDDDYYYVFSHLVLPLIDRFAPDLIVVAAGFDSSIYDQSRPQGGYHVSTSCYAHLMRAVLLRVPEGRVVCTLEGGYDPYGLAVNVEATLQVLSDFNFETALHTAFPAQEHRAALETVASVQAVKDTFKGRNCNLWWDVEA